MSMRQALKSLIKTLPGFEAVDKYLCHRYTGTYPYKRERYPRGHFYSPLPDVEEFARNTSSIYRWDLDLELEGCLDLQLAEQKRSLAEMAAAHHGTFDWPAESTAGYRYYFDNGTFMLTDAVALFFVLRHYQPSRLVEVGAGYSTALLLDINERFLGQRVRLSSIEPYPDTLRSLMTEADRQTLELEPIPVQDSGLERFEALGSGDVLFIDSSHVIKPGSDVHYLMFDVLPRLKPGVLVHIHDIRWPFQYLAKSVIAGRAWNEAYVVRAFLMYNTAFEVVLWPSYLEHRCQEYVRRHAPKMLERPGTSSSLWLRKTTPSLGKQADMPGQDGAP